MKMWTTAIIASLVTVLAGVAAAEPNVTEGMWDITGSMKMEGLPFPVPTVPISYSQCITKKDLVPQQKEKNKDCTITSQKIEGNTVTWAVSCLDKKGAKTEGTGTITYKGESFEGKMQNTMTDSKGGKIESRMEMTGKRTGACK